MDIQEKPAVRHILQEDIKIFQGKKIDRKKKIFTIHKVLTNKKNRKKKFILNKKYHKNNDDINQIPLSYTSNLDSSENPNSLIAISRVVQIFLKLKKSVIGSELTKYIQEIHTDLKSKKNISFKNIQRRVYDVINVMVSIGMLDKINSSLIYKGEKNRKSHALLVQQINTVANRVHQKQYELISKCCEIMFMQQLISFNQKDLKRKFSQDKLDLPFFLIKQDSDADFLIRHDDDNSRVAILSNNEINLFEPEQIVKYYIKDDCNSLETFMRNTVPSHIVDYIIKHGLIERYVIGHSLVNTTKDSSQTKNASEYPSVENEIFMNLCSQYDMRNYCEETPHSEDVLMDPLQQYSLVFDEVVEKGVHTKSNHYPHKI